MDIYLAQSIGLAVALPSVPLYALECAIILWHWRRSFNTSFFRLFLFSALNNLFLNFLLYIPVLRISELGLFVDHYRAMPNWVPKMFFCDSFFTFHMENFFTVLIIAHRLSAILWPMDFEQIWRYGLPIGIVFCAAASLALTSPIFPLDVRFNEENGTLFRRVITGYSYDPKKPIFNAYQLLFFCSIFFLAIATALNLGIILAYKLHRHRTRTTDQNVDGAPFRGTLEFRLYVYTLAMFIGQMLHCGYYIVAYLYSIFPKKLGPLWLLMVNQYIWINDLRVLAFPAWFLFWASSEMATQIRAATALAWAGSRGRIRTIWQFGCRLAKRHWFWWWKNGGSRRRRRRPPRPSNQPPPLFIVRFPNGRRWTHPLVIPLN